MLGAYLMTSRLNQSQVNNVIGWVLFVAAAKMIHSLLKPGMWTGFIILFLGLLFLSLWFTARSTHKANAKKEVHPKI